MLATKSETAVSIRVADHFTGRSTGLFTGVTGLSIVLVIGVALCATAACGGTPPPPKRGVLEHNVANWRFRRYQQLQDVEVWVKGNAAVAHTSSYLRGEAEKKGDIGDKDLVNAFVTRYQQDRGIVRATIVFARRLVQESGYKIDEDKLGGVYLLTISGHDENWVIWPAKNHVIKLGGRYLENVPRALIKAYGERYPSQLKDGMLDGPLPEDPDADKKDDDKEKYDPDNPAPDWDQYKKNKQKKTKKKGKK